MKNEKETTLPITDELDFAYLLELMLPLHNEVDFAWLPELFSIIGHERLTLLCKYAGGETIKIPTLEQLVDSISAFQYFYDIKIAKKRSIDEVPKRLTKLVNKISKCYNRINDEDYIK